MGRTSGKTGKARRGSRPRRHSRPSVALREPRERGWARLRSALNAAPGVLLHPQTPDAPVWKFLWPMLAVAFAVRAAIALSGDFILHPDEIMQYLEPAHDAVFGNGVVYWEIFYGARSWLVPGLVAGVLELLDVAGLGHPRWYVGGVELTFCAVSLLIPAGMYFFARRHLDETAARVALIAGALWYELVGFAHKPMTEFVAAALLTVLLALCVRPSPNRPGVVWPVAFFAVLAAAVRIQYAPLALALLGLFLLRAGKGAKAQLALAAGVFFLAVGVFDAVTRDAGLFHSFRSYLAFNLTVDREAAGAARPVHEYFWWLLFTGGGLSALGIAAALRDPRRYGFLLLLIALLLFTHSAQAHKDYRYVFAFMPLWLLVGTGVVAQLAARTGRPIQVYGLAGAVFATISLAGILNALPFQQKVYDSTYAGTIKFIRGQDPIFAAYRYLASAPGVAGVWQVDRVYANTPGYYHLHRKVPFYDSRTGRGNDLHKDAEALRTSVSHLVSQDPNLAVSGYVTEKAFGNVRILRREDNRSPVRRWQGFNPTITDNMFDTRFGNRIYPDAAPPPANNNIRFVAPE